jgi:hypothetical protein
VIAVRFIKHRPESLVVPNIGLQVYHTAIRVDRGFEMLDKTWPGLIIPIAEDDVGGTLI